MKLETKRLYFRPFTEEDLNILYRIRGQSVVMKHVPGGARSLEVVKQDLLDEIAHQKKHGYSKWACFLKATDEFIGRAGFSLMENGQVEVGYGFLPEYWGKGYATEALDAMLKWAFANIDVPEIIAFSHKDNLASKRVMEKCGMKFCKQEFVDNVPYDLYYKKRLDQA